MFKFETIIVLGGGRLVHRDVSSLQGARLHLPALWGSTGRYHISKKSCPFYSVLNISWTNSITISSHLLCTFFLVRGFSVDKIVFLKFLVYYKQILKYRRNRLFAMFAS